MICVIFGKDKDLVVDEFVLAIMASICVFAAKPLNKFNYTPFLVDQIHYQLSEFESLRHFKYQYYLVHLFLFSQDTHFACLGSKVEDEIGNPISVIHWTPLINKKHLNVGFSEHIDLFMSKAYKIIYSEIPTRIFPKCKKLL